MFNATSDTIVNYQLAIDCNMIPHVQYVMPPLSYFHGKKLKKWEETNAGMNSKNIMNNVGIFSNNIAMNSVSYEV